MGKQKPINPNYIKMLRDDAGLSQAELAKSIGVHQTVISDWESGKNSPSMPYREKLVEFFGISLDELTAGVVESEQNQNNRGLTEDEVRRLIHQEALGPLLHSLKDVSTLDVLKSIDARLEAIQSHLIKFIK